MKIRPLYRLLTWLVIIGLIIISALAYYFQTHEKDLFLTALRTSLKQNISASDVDYDFPFGFHLDDFQIEGVIQAKRLSVQFDPQSIREQQLILTRLVLNQAIIIWNKNQHRKAVNKTAVGSNQAQKTVAKSPLDGPHDIRLLIKQLHVKNGRLHFVDTTTTIPFTFQLDKLQMKAEELAFPLKPMTTTFQLQATLIKRDNPLSGSLVKSSGWIDLSKKNLNGQLFVLEKNGQAGLSAQAVAQDNNMTVEGKIRAKNLFSDQTQASLEKAVDNMFLNALSNIGVEIGANFAFNTKLDDFRIEKISFSGSVSTHSVSGTTNPVAP